MSNLRMALVAAAVPIVALTACSSSSKTVDAGGSPSDASAVTSTPVVGAITVLAASSLTGTFAAIAKQFEALHPGTKVTLSLGSSATLATQITQGNPADVFAAASTATMKTVTDAGLAVAVTTFAKNTMEIATLPGNPKHIATVNDLAGAGLKVALCEVTAPCGKAAATVLSNASVTLKPVSLEQDVKSTLAKVELGEVDAGIVYVTDVKVAGSKVAGVAIPADVNVVTSYPISALKQAKNPATAAAFAAYVESPAGQQVLQAAGFVAP